MLSNKIDISRTYRICEKDENNGKLRLVIFNITWYNNQRLVFSSKKKLKDSGISITEFLTPLRKPKLNEAMKELGFCNF